MDADIVIMGGGIAGPALACGLRNRGYSIVLVEQSADPLDTARGDHLQPRTCEILDRWKALESFFAQGAEKRLGARWLTSDGEVLLDVAVDDLPIPQPFHLYLNHERISDVLLKLAHENDEFSLLRPAKGKVVIADDGHPRVVIQHADGAEDVIDPKILVGADGRGSVVRKVMGIAAEVHDYENPLVILFGSRLWRDERNDVQAYLGPKGNLTLIPRTDEHWKIGRRIDKSDIAWWKGSSVSDRAAFLRDVVPALDGIETEIAGFYPIKMLNADTWVAGNTVLIGDACHALHPGRSQGMNVSIRCVDQLIEHLPPQDKLNDRNEIAGALVKYQKACKPEIDEVLKENHKRGAEMDTVTVESMPAVMENYRAMSRDPERRFRYRMQAAGYPL